MISSAKSPPIQSSNGDKLTEGHPIFVILLKIPRAQVVGVGNVARDVLTRFEAKLSAARKNVGASHAASLHVRHPAHGGEAEFREGLCNLLGVTLDE